MNSILSPASLSSYFSPETGTVRTVDLYVYAGGTTDTLIVYKDAGLNVAHPQPIATTGAGRVPPIFVGELPDNGYRIRALDAETGELIEDVDGLPGAEPDPAEVPPPTEIDEQALMVTGDVIANFSNAALRAGFVRLNGGTIGSASSGATERAAADAEDLFKHLWQQDAGLRLEVVGGRGGTASSDWLANKAIRLPDLRGKGIIGLIDMGNGTSTTLLAGALWDAGTGLTPGDWGGRGSHTITIPEMPEHDHVLTDPQHTHTINQTAHTHSTSAHDHTVPLGEVTNAYGLTGDGAYYKGRIVVTGTTGVSNVSMTNTPVGSANAVVTNANAATGITMAKTGGSAEEGFEGDPVSHNNFQPSLALTFYMKL